MLSPVAVIFYAKKCRLTMYISISFVVQKNTLNKFIENVTEQIEKGGQSQSQKESSTLIAVTNTYQCRISNFTTVMNITMAISELLVLRQNTLTNQVYSELNLPKAFSNFSFFALIV